MNNEYLDNDTEVSCSHQQGGCQRGARRCRNRTIHPTVMELLSLSVLVAILQSGVLAIRITYTIIRRLRRHIVHKVS
jgi:hypothetical protein